MAILKDVSETLTEISNTFDNIHEDYKKLSKTKEYQNKEYDFRSIPTNIPNVINKAYENYELFKSEENKYPFLYFDIDRRSYLKNLSFCTQEAKRKDKKEGYDTFISSRSILNADISYIMVEKGRHFCFIRSIKSTTPFALSCAETKLVNNPVLNNSILESVLFLIKHNPYSLEDSYVFTKKESTDKFSKHKFYLHLQYVPEQFYTFLETSSLFVFEVDPITKEVLNNNKAINISFDKSEKNQSFLDIITLFESLEPSTNPKCKEDSETSSKYKEPSTSSKYEDSEPSISTETSLDSETGSKYEDLETSSKYKDSETSSKYKEPSTSSKYEDSSLCLDLEESKNNDKYKDSEPSTSTASKSFNKVKTIYIDSKHKDKKKNNVLDIVYSEFNIISGQKPWTEEEKLKRDIGSSDHHGVFTHKSYTKTKYKPSVERKKRNKDRKK